MIQLNMTETFLHDQPWQPGPDNLGKGMLKQAGKNGK